MLVDKFIRRQRSINALELGSRMTCLKPNFNLKINYGRHPKFLLRKNYICSNLDKITNPTPSLPQIKLLQLEGLGLSLETLLTLIFIHLVRGDFQQIIIRCTSHWIKVATITFRTSHTFST